MSKTNSPSGPDSLQDVVHETVGKRKGQQHTVANNELPPVSPRMRSVLVHSRPWPTTLPQAIQTLDTLKEGALWAFASSTLRFHNRPHLALELIVDGMARFAGSIDDLTIVLTEFVVVLDMIKRRTNAPTTQRTTSVWCPAYDTLLSAAAKTRTR